MTIRKRPRISLCDGTPEDPMARESLADGNESASIPAPVAFRSRVPKVSIVVLNWNGWEDTINCLKSLRRLSYESYEIVVVDNGSTNDSVRRIHDRFPSVTIIRLDRNLGFSGGSNVGIRSAFASGSEYVWLLNNDTTVDPNALGAMVEAAEKDSRIGAVGSVIYDMHDPHIVQTWGGGNISLWFGRSSHRTEKTSENALDYLTGASLLLRRQSLEDVGVLDEGFFMYWEDADLCFRLRNASWRLAVACDSHIWHKKCSSSGKNKTRFDWLLWKSTVRFCEIHAPLAFIPMVVATLRMLARRVLRLEWKRAAQLCKGIVIYFADGFQESEGSAPVRIDQRQAAGAKK